MSATLDEIKAELTVLRALVEGVAAGLKPAAQSRPLTAEELIERWKVRGKTQADQLHNLAARCREWGLRPMRGTRGITATYMIADVEAAEAFSNGTMKRRRHAA